MDGDALPMRARLQAWRTHGADRMDPVRFAFLEALASRAHAQQGEARRLLDARLSGLIASYADDLDDWSSRATATLAPSSDASALRALVVSLQQRTPIDDPDAPSPGQAPPALDEARRVWTQVRTDSQLRATLDARPADAGPLNSATLVHRALHLMRDVSPGYLQHFIAYADTLSSLEQFQQALGPLTPDGVDTTKPASRGRTRKRRA